jgi:hypothetical protein
MWLEGLSVPVMLTKGIHGFPLSVYDALWSPCRNTERVDTVVSLWIWIKEVSSSNVGRVPSIILQVKVGALP